MKMADAAHRATGARHYVMAGSREGNKPALVVVDRNNFRTLKRKGYLPQTTSLGDLVRDSFYFTSHRDGSGWLTTEDARAKRERYFRWCSAVRKRN